MENGAIRNFESIRLAEKQAEVEAKQKKEEEENNPMKVKYFNFFNLIFKLI